MKIQISGASDDLIEINGDIEEEFCGENLILEFSEGTVVQIQYGSDETACWRIKVLKKGLGSVIWVQTGDEDAENNGELPRSYSDAITIEYEDLKVVKTSDD